MIAALWSSLGSESVKHYAARLFTTAALFWLAGAALVIWHNTEAALPKRGWIADLTAATGPLQDLPPVTVGALFLGAMAVVVGSALGAERFSLDVLRLLEGYWLRPTRWRAKRVRRWQSAREEAMRTYQSFHAARISGAPASAAQELELARATNVLRTIPAAPELVMPTRLGNVLRVAESRPLRKHGVDAIACWPHLWLVLPADTRTEVAAARERLDAAVRGWLWGVLLLVWTPWAWWAPAVTLVAVSLAYANCLRAAATYAILLEAAFDVHLPLLYRAVRFPVPQSAAHEAACGERLTRYLRDGSDDPAMVFTVDREG